MNRVKNGKTDILMKLLTLSAKKEDTTSFIHKDAAIIGYSYLVFSYLSKNRICSHTLFFCIYREKT